MSAATKAALACREGPVRVNTARGEPVGYIFGLPTVTQFLPGWTTARVVHPGKNCVTDALPRSAFQPLHLTVWRPAVDVAVLASGARGYQAACNNSCHVVNSSVLAEVGP